MFNAGTWHSQAAFWLRRKIFISLRSILGLDFKSEDCWAKQCLASIKHISLVVRSIPYPRTTWRKFMGASGKLFDLNKILWVQLHCTHLGRPQGINHPPIYHLTATRTTSRLFPSCHSLSVSHRSNEIGTAAVSERLGVNSCSTIVICHAQRRTRRCFRG